MNNPKISLNSEVGQLRGVVLHKPGIEIEKMQPSTAHSALYSDMLTREVAVKEYAQLQDFLSLITQTFCFDYLLSQTLNLDNAREDLFKQALVKDIDKEELSYMRELSSVDLSRYLIEGPPYDKKLSEKAWLPLYNLYFTRDIGVCFNNKSMPTKMSTTVRSAEAVLTSLIYKYNPLFSDNSSWVSPWNEEQDACLEGGDFLVAAENVFLIGQGCRSNIKGVEKFIEAKSAYTDIFYILTQELPSEPESFIHLDMVFTLLSRGKCMVYKPLLEGKLKTRLLTIKNGKIKEEIVDNLLCGLDKLNMHYEPVYCGGGDLLYQEREQWHSGANFFAVAPGHIMGYGRNRKTIEALSNAGFEVVSIEEATKNTGAGAIARLEREDKPTVYTMNSAELVRGGGGCRCMTMPISRDVL